MNVTYCFVFFLLIVEWAGILFKEKGKRIMNNEEWILNFIFNAINLYLFSSALYIHWEHISSDYVDV